MKKLLVLFSLVTILGLVVLLKSLPVNKAQATCNQSCTERTLTKHQDWIAEYWQCKSGYTEGWWNNWHYCEKNGWKHDFDDKKEKVNAHWENWSNWSTDSCTPSTIKHCESKVQHQIGCGEWVDGNCPPPTSTPTPTPTQTPSPTPTVTPTVTLTPTPTIRECKEGEYLFENECIPNPTGTPTPTVQPTQPPSNDDHSGPTWSPRVDFSFGWPMCDGIYPGTPLLQGLKRVSDTQVELSWWPASDVNFYSLIFGYQGEPMNMGAVYIDPHATSILVNYLRPNSFINAQLWAWRGQCVTRSNIVDP